MLNSVGGDYVAGQEYEVDDDTGNRFVTLGFAETSDQVAPYTDAERDLELHQVVSLGG